MNALPRALRLGLVPAALLPAALLPALQDAPSARPRLDRAQVEAAARVAGLEFDDKELALMLRDVVSNLRSFERLRALPLDNAIPPAIGFTPFLPGIEPRLDDIPANELALLEVERPKDLEELAYADIVTLASLIKSRKVSCVELTTTFLYRLRRLDPKLHCVISFCDERALAQAKRLDAELAEGKWRGPLHGIPYGAKDLLAAKGYRTTWGAAPFRAQVLDFDATVIRKLEAAGAVLIAKLTLGALAWGDVWFGGMTRNPWNPKQGSSGSSAGSAAATAAGGVVFAIGSETLGSIVSPSTRCGCSSLRPTFGRVSRHGAMALSWSMDKLGPLCRSATDAAIVFGAILGPGGDDPGVIDLPYTLPVGVEVKGWKVGYVESAFGGSARDKKVLDELRALGVELVPVELPGSSRVVRDLVFILNAEAATAFDEMTRDGRDDELVRQVRRAWPNVFRASRLIPAVEYIRANRVRTRLMRDMDAVMAKIDVLVHPSFDATLTLTNLTGHPTFVAPSGFSRGGMPYSISFTGRLGGEAALLALAQAWQAKTAHHRKHPDI